MNIWNNVISQSFIDIWIGIVNYSPKIIIAILIVIIGWIVGALVAKVIAQIIGIIRLDEALRAAGIDELVTRIGLTLNSGEFIGALFKWFIIAVSLVGSFNVLELYQVNAFLQGVVLNYIPQVIAAVFILLLSAVIGEAVRKAVIRAAKAAEVTSAGLIGTIAKWSIWVFGILAALLQLNIAARVIEIAFTGVIVALALAFGLSFGLGGQQAAANYIEKVRREISSKGE